MSKITRLKNCNFKTQQQQKNYGLSGLGGGNFIFLLHDFGGKKQQNLKAKMLERSIAAIP